MSDYDYDLFVIGGGSGGVRAARVAAELGKRVGIAEEYRFGGTCVIRGCVPKKLLVYGSRYRTEIEDAQSYGWSYEDLRFDWPTLIGNVQREVDRLNGIYTRNLENAGVDRFLTRATVIDPHSIALANVKKPVTSEYILVATGGWFSPVSHATERTTCPITTVEMKKPMRHKKCGHSYEKEAIIQHIKRPASKGRAKCPIGGCVQYVTLNDLEPNTELERIISRKNRKK